MEYKLLLQSFLGPLIIIIIAVSAIISPINNYNGEVFNTQRNEKQIAINKTI